MLFYQRVPRVILQGNPSNIPHKTKPLGEILHRRFLPSRSTSFTPQTAQGFFQEFSPKILPLIKGKGKSVWMCRCLLIINYPLLFRMPRKKLKIPHNPNLNLFFFGFKKKAQGTTNRWQSQWAEGWQAQRESRLCPRSRHEP